MRRQALLQRLRAPSWPGRWLRLRGRAVVTGRPVQHYLGRLRAASRSDCFDDHVLGVSRQRSEVNLVASEDCASRLRHRNYDGVNG